MYRYNNVFEMIEKGAKKFPGKKYLFFKNTHYTYKQTYEKILHTAHVLADNDVKKGDRVIIFLHNCPEYIFSYFAIIAIGAIAVPTNYFLKENELTVNMNDCAASYIITSPVYEKIMQSLQRRVNSLKKIFTYEKANFESTNINNQVLNTEEFRVKPGINDIAALIYTSGTTGFPKGVMLTHKNLLANANSVSVELGSKHSYRFTAVLPLFHSYSFMVNIMGALYDLCSVILLESVTDLQTKEFKKQTLFLRPDVFTGVPQIFAAMSRKKLNFFQKLILPFKYYISGGAALPVETIENFKKVYGKPIIEGYGLSEASPVVALNPLDHQKAGTVGTVFYGGEIKIVDDKGNNLSINMTGELCYKGDNVMKGYWNHPEETAKVIKNGWLHTGDLANIDEDGFITICGRLKELIITKGMNVYPREIEELLYRHESVSIAAVLGIPSKDGDEMIVAFVKPENAELSEQELRNYTRKNIADYKVPKHFIITNNIPVNASGKILKKDLQQIASKMYPVTGQEAHNK